MKKVIIIASAIVSIIFSILIIYAGIMLFITFLERQNDRFGGLGIIGIPIIILAFSTLLISIIVLFNIKLSLILRITTIIISFFTIVIIMVLGLFLIPVYSPLVYPSSFIATLWFITAIITLITYIHRALKPGEKKDRFLPQRQRDTEANSVPQ